MLRTSSPLRELTDQVAPFVAQEAETVWRLRDVYLSVSGSHALAECLVVVRGRVTRFFVHLAQREEDGAVVVRPYPVPTVEPAPSVKRMVALVAEAVRDAHPDVEIGSTTIRDFLSDRYGYAPDPEPMGWDPLLLERGLPRPVAWPAVFGNDHPVEVEIGAGKGTFVVAAAEAHPESNFVAIELSKPYAEHVRDRVRRRNLRNVRVVRAEAARFLGEHAPPGSLRAVHVYFPDPWPKKRHHKRRLLQPSFVDAVAAALAPGGELRLVTDHEAYFAEATALCDQHAALQAAPYPAGETDLTNYERKYRVEGRPIHRARYVRK